MLNALKSRLDARKQANEQRDAQEQERLKRMERIVEQAGKMEDLIDDSRYHDYQQLLIEARESLVHQLVNLKHENASEEYAHDVAFLQGRIFQLDSILKTPETFLALADEQRHSANGTSRQSVPSDTARHATSARI